MKTKLQISIPILNYDNSGMMPTNTKGKFCDIHQKRNSIWMLVASTLIAFIGFGNQEIKAQETVKIELSDNKTISDSTSAKPRRGTKTITGIVYDENNNPLPGTTITIKNYKISSNANSNGEFTIKAKKGDILIFFYIGYENVELKLKNETSIKIYLKPDSKSKGEVVKIKFKKE